MYAPMASPAQGAPLAVATPRSSCRSSPLVPSLVPLSLVISQT
jgi:hypothetical protein